MRIDATSTWRNNVITGFVKVVTWIVDFIRTKKQEERRQSDRETDRALNIIKELKDTINLFLEKKASFGDVGASVSELQSTVIKIKHTDLVYSLFPKFSKLMTPSNPEELNKFLGYQVKWLLARVEEIEKEKH